MAAKKKPVSRPEPEVLAYAVEVTEELGLDGKVYLAVTRIVRRDGAPLSESELAQLEARTATGSKRKSA